MLNYRLKKYLLFLLLLLVPVSVFSQIDPKNNQSEKDVSISKKAGNFINVNVPPYPESGYTPQQLVENVFVKTSNTCTVPNIFNAKVTPNQLVTSTSRQWGYFHKGTTNFPFEDGIVLSTGQAKKTGNSFLTGLNDWMNMFASDADLVAATNPGQQLHDAIALEFDFVATSYNISFNYLLASEEYQTGFPCGNFSDTFAILLKKTADPSSMYQNMALLPGGAGPVKVTNIVPVNYGCGPINEQFFYGHNLAHTETNFKGRLFPMIAYANVIPGETYHIKIVLADAKDLSFDTAVFLQGDSFNLGVSIVDGSGIVLPNPVPMCDGNPKTLIAQTASIPGMTYQWFLDGNPIAGASTNTYIATVPGDYEVEVSFPGLPCPGKSKVTIVGSTTPVVHDAILTECYQGATTTFDLTSAESDMSSIPGMVFKYYQFASDAIAGNGNNYPNPTAFTTSYNQTVYVNISNGVCSNMAKLELVTASKIVASIAPQSQDITCLVPEILLDATASVRPANAIFNWSASGGGNIVSGGNTLTPTVDGAGTYTLTISLPGNSCTSVASINVTENKTLPIIGITAPQLTICLGESVQLTASGGISYSWAGLPGTGNTQTVSPTATTTYSVTGTGLNGCTSAPATITIHVIPAIVSDLKGGQICPGDNIVLDAGSGPNYTYLWSNGATTQSIMVNSLGTYSVTINNGFCSKTFTAQVTQAIVPQITKVDYNNGLLTIAASNPSNGELEYSIDGGVTWQTSNTFTNVLKNTWLVIQVKIKRTSCVGVLDYFTFVMNNIITPNGDGINDFIDFSGISKYDKFKAVIFDRYGKEVFKTEKNKTKWDGFYLGRPLPTSSYWYQINYDDPAIKQPIIKTGWILLKNRE
ncbi:choice-of-anchor L domain-containing protein [Chryseobacterium sp. MMS23-Vi53]|uniref:choice-of-anchor L domain-containing protein n=1 Tax=Chryseobacterium sp. MMS23-Vi53 TaxID=3386644 RepID=UPI0039EB0BD9